MNEFEDAETQLDQPAIVPSGSIVDLLKADLNEIASHRDVFIRVVGYEKSGIQIKYRMPEGGKELDSISQKVERETKDRFARNLNIMIDTMIALCEGVYVQPVGVEEPVPFDPKDDGVACRFDEILAEYIDMNGAGPLTSRAIVKKLFGNNEFAIVNHAEKLQRWLIDSGADVQREFWELGG